MVMISVLGLSIAFQLLAAILALRLIRITGRHFAWICISTALVLMALRRGVTLAGVFMGDPVSPQDLGADFVALFTSMLMAFGIHLIGPLFAAIQESKNALSNLSQELEEKVHERTAELMAAKVALVQSHQELEQLVEERTSDLWQANSQLAKEIGVRRQAEKDLAAEKEHLAVTLASIGDGVITTDTETRVVLMNHPAEEMTGWTLEEAAGKPLESVFHIIDERTRERCEDPAKRVLASGSVMELSNHTALIARDATERIIADSGSPIRDQDGSIIGVVMVFRDITEKRTQEEEIRRIEKLESIGLLAGGIAHDFNNILTAIVGNIRLASMYAGTDDKIVDLLSAAEKASLRATDLTQQLLTFAKGGAPIKEVARVSEVVRQCACFALRGSNVRCDFDLPDDLWMVEIDEGQIGQVIDNLVINADQAMPDGGVVTIIGENISIGSKQESGTSLARGDYVKLTVIDSGCGIPKEDLTKVFDPYFSTKSTGSGLGLTSSYSIIKQHDGVITVESEVGVGTRFHIYLPASPGRELSKTEPDEGATAGVGRILVVDDEEVIRDVTRDALTLLGYSAECVVDGMQAVELYRRELERGTPFHVVIMDLTIPGGMGGKATMERLLEIDPDVKAIVSSGYSNDPIMAAYGEYGFKGIVPKPYNIDQLSRVLREVLGDSVLG
jgi:PAS domain S-box-containing protein